LGGQCVRQFLRTFFTSDTAARQAVTKACTFCKKGAKIRLFSPRALTGFPDFCNMVLEIIFKVFYKSDKEYFLYGAHRF